jgi:hypothetical protein
MDNCDARFRALLTGSNEQDFEEHASAVYGLWPDLTLAYVNPAWVRFAHENGGHDTLARYGLGCFVPAAISRPLRGYYQTAYRRCLDEVQAWEHRYECSSAAEYRLMHMSVYPLAEADGLIVVNSCIAARPHEHESHSSDERLYLDINGHYHQCSHCRRTQQARAPRVWDWVPEWVDRSPLNTSHVICPACLEEYYPELEEQGFTPAKGNNGLLVGV